MKAPIPADEKARLRALHRYEILDTESEQEYDDITLLASQICDVPIAAINLVDTDRQWIKSKVGVDITETPRETSFCAHGILTDSSQMMIVRDTLEDERFLDNPFVTGNPNIRFYAGAPLVTPDNHAIGMLCVVDHEPRELTDQQLDSLQALARQITVKLELRRMSSLLRSANEDLRNLSLIDDLTGLFNRRGFLFHAEQQLKLFRKRPSNSGLFLLFADMDGLKKINDTYGHEEGSASIIAFAKILRKTFRDSDVIARPGGDEFTVLIINAAGQVGDMITERLQKNIDGYNQESEKPFGLSASCGLVEIEFDGKDSIEEIIQEADRKMYEHKRSRKAARL